MLRALLFLAWLFGAAAIFENNPLEDNDAHSNG